MINVRTFCRRGVIFYLLFSMRHRFFFFFKVLRPKEPFITTGPVSTCHLKVRGVNLVHRTFPGPDAVASRECEPTADVKVACYSQQVEVLTY